MVTWRRRLAHTVLTSALFLICFSPCIFAIFLPSYQSCIASEHFDQAAQKQQGALRGVGILIRCEAVLLNRNAGALTALGTFAIAFFTLTLWRVTNNAVRVARDEFNATHRPKIVCLFFEPFEGAGDDNDGVEITYVNAGTAPAIMLEIGWTIIATQNLRPGVIMESISLNRKTVAPGEKGKRGIESLLATAIHVQAAHPEYGGAPPFYCIGYIAYQDRAGARRETGFCRSFDLERKCWLGVPNSEYEYSY